MSDKALRMLKHMRVQIRMQSLMLGTRAASVWRAARTIGLKPEEGEFDALLKELLRGGYIEPYPSPSPCRARAVPTYRFGHIRG
jgi:hypothetical protein